VQLNDASVVRRTLPTAPHTCLSTALERLSRRPIKETTHKEYLATLRAVDWTDVPFNSVTVAMLTTRLQRVLGPNTRRKHAINLRACLGLPIPCPKALRRHYYLPSLDSLMHVIEGGTYRMWGYAMLLAGLRLGEACTNFPLLHYSRTTSTDEITVSVAQIRMPTGASLTDLEASPVRQRAAGTPRHHRRLRSVPSRKPWPTRDDC
jgi:hypothetical protein